MDQELLLLLGDLRFARERYLDGYSVRMRDGHRDYQLSAAEMSCAIDNLLHALKEKGVTV